jgi:hypothetical protein
MRAITSNYINLGYFTLNQTIKNFVCVEATSRGAKDGSTFLMNILHNIWRQRDPVLFNIGVKAFVAPFYPVDFFDFIIIMQTHEKFSNDNIQARTESSASYDANFRVFRIAQNVSSGTRLDEFD